MKRARSRTKTILKAVSGSRGVVLLLTLAVITLVAATVSAIHKRVREARGLPAAYGSRMALITLASSGIHAAMAVLAQDRADSDIDSIQESWADAEFLKKVTAALPFESGEMTVRITDELGKIQVNALVRSPEGQRFNDAQKRLWDAFLLYFKGALSLQNLDLQPEVIVSAMKDWMDSGDGDAVTGLGGAESDYYQGLKPPYACKNGPMAHLGEMALIKGMPPDLFTALGGVSGFSAHLTVHGVSKSSGSVPEFKGKININTAGLPVLAALLPLGEQGLAQSIYDFRADRTGSVFLHDLSDPQWYRKAPGCSHLRIDPDLITVTSDVFRIEAAATLGTAGLTAVAVVSREKNEKTSQWTCKVLSWHVI